LSEVGLDARANARNRAWPKTNDGRYTWDDLDRSSIANRYDRIAGLIPIFDWLFFQPPGFRAKAVAPLDLEAGGRVLEIGCGTGRNLPFLHRAVGPAGRIYGVDLSEGMLTRARHQCERNGWDNVELIQRDAADFAAPEPLDGVMFGLSYNTMPHHLAVLRQAWNQLRPGGRLVIMDAKLRRVSAAN
jgi:ubiquinone/menaquinone biosynthesis C-methylase UbiE